MNRVLLIALMLSAGLAGCADDPSGHHGGPPPKDPADYHGVPTDDRPPVMAPSRLALSAYAHLGCASRARAQ